MAIRKTAAVRRGLQELRNLAEADVQASDSDDVPRWQKKRREEIGRALEWLDEQCADPKIASSTQKEST